MPEGILCIDKPEGFTSFDVVAKARGITRCRKIGHGGTLDPMATGVLPLFLGRAVKATALIPDQDKRYRATVQFGLATDSQDSTGALLSQTDATITRQQLEVALDTQRGVIQQLPPMHSAVWVDGQRLYKLARQGKEIDRPLREVTIYSLDLLEFHEDRQEAVLDVFCSKGTFVRTICHDLGQTLGVGGILTALRRTQTLGYHLDRCITLEQLSDICQAGELDQLLQPVDEVFAQYQRVFLSPRQEIMFLNGVRLDLDRIRHPDTQELLRVYGSSRFLGLARLDREAGELEIVKLFVTLDQGGTA